MRGDLYALGATLYELLTLQPAFDERDPARLIRQIGEQPVTPLRQHDRRISRDLETIVLKALARDPKDRFATAGELRDELRRFLEGRPIRSRPVGSAERAWRWCKRNPIVAGLLALVIGLSVTLAAGSTACAAAAPGVVRADPARGRPRRGEFPRGPPGRQRLVHRGSARARCSTPPACSPCGSSSSKTP